MARRARTVRRLARRGGPDGRWRREPVTLAAEEPLAIELDGVRVATTMRTPGHDFELAVGFCHGEGLLDGYPVRTVRYCATGSAVETAFNVVSVSTGRRSPDLVARLGLTTSSCGFCGTTGIEELAERLAPVDGEPLPGAALAAAADRLRGAQSLFDETGAVHAAGVIEPDGSVATVREDVGRHNAVDKVVGRLLLDDRLPATRRGLVVSGRASFELVHKAWAAGFRALVAVSAPTALAVATAERAGMQLAGFARDGALTVYTAGDAPPCGPGP